MLLRETWVCDCSKCCWCCCHSLMSAVVLIDDDMPTHISSWPFVFNLANSIIGVAVLALPFCFKEVFELLKHCKRIICTLVRNTQ